MLITNNCHRNLKNVTHLIIIHEYFYVGRKKTIFGTFYCLKMKACTSKRIFCDIISEIPIISVNSIIWKLIFLLLKDLLSNVSFPFHYIIHNVYLFSLSTEVLKLLIHTSRMKLNGYIRSMNSFWWTYDESELRNHRR